MRLSWTYNGLDSHSDLESESDDLPGATAVEAIKTDLKKVAVAYQNSIIKIFDIETGKEVSRLQGEGKSLSDFYPLIWGLLVLLCADMLCFFLLDAKLALLLPRLIVSCHILLCLSW